MYLASNFAQVMNSLLLNAFFDTVNFGIGPIVTYIFIFLLVIEMIYVMAKYLGSEKKN